MLLVEENEVRAGRLRDPGDAHRPELEDEQAEPDAAGLELLFEQVGLHRDQRVAGDPIDDSVWTLAQLKNGVHYRGIDALE